MGDPVADPMLTGYGESDTDVAGGRAGGGAVGEQ